MSRAIRPVIRLIATTFTLLLAPILAIHSHGFDHDPDLWWHVRVGDWITQRHAFPRVGIFSQHIERPWIAYSWGFDLLTSVTQAVFGLPGIPLMLICIELCISLVFFLVIRRIGGGFWSSWCIATAGIWAFYVDVPRPVLFTLLFFIVELYLIFEADFSGKDMILYWMGPLFLIWANCHIQFTYGIGVLALYIVSRIIQALVHNSSDKDNSSTFPPAKLTFVLALAVISSCIGPNWWMPYKVAVTYVGQTYIYQVIQEMMAMNFRRPEHYVELLLVMVACFVLGRSRRKDVFRPLLLLTTAIISFRSLRDMWFVAIAASLVIAEGLRGGPDSPAKVSEPGTWDSRPVGYALASLVALVLSFQFGMSTIINTGTMAREIGDNYPIRAVEFVRNSHLPGPIYNSFNWGGFLIFTLPEQPVSIDPRTDLYGSEIFRRALATTNGTDWQGDPDLARSNLVILERHLPLVPILAQDPNYRLAYQDALAVIFVRARVQ